MDAGSGVCAGDTGAQDDTPRQVPVGVLTRMVSALDDRRAACSEARPDPRLRDHLRRAAERPGMTALFLDVFDTVLLRDGMSEIRRFHGIAERWVAQAPGCAVHDPVDLLLARVAATRTVYRVRPDIEGCREGHIDDILALTCHAVGLPPATARSMKDIELACEAERLAPNRLLVEFAASCRSAGIAVVLVSDMYLDAKSISHLVADVTGEPELFKDVVSSADTVISKRSGRLFPHLIEQRSLDPRNCVHVGDSLAGDIGPARDAGLGFVHFPVSDKELAMRQTDEAAFLQDLRERGLELGAWWRGER